MDKMNEALQRIYTALSSTEKIATSVDDWTLILEYCKGTDYIETISNLQNFIKNKFSFAIEKGAEGFVYFGNLDNNNKVGIYKVMNAYSDQYSQYYGYISSTQAGKLFNDEGFGTALKEWANEIYTNNNIEGFINSDSFFNSLFDGKDASGYISEAIKLTDSKTELKSVRAFNDFFSENYVNNLKCSNINTVFLGNVEKGED